MPDTDDATAAAEAWWPFTDDDRREIVAYLEAWEHRDSDYDPEREPCAEAKLLAAHDDLATRLASSVA